LIRGLVVSVLVTLIVFLGAFGASAQSVQFDNGASQSVSNGTSVSINNFTIANQPNRYLVVATGHVQNVNGINSVTWNGSEALTSLGQITSNSNIRMSIWGLKNPTATTGAITVSYSDQLNDHPGPLLAASFYNVDQTTPTVGSVATAAGSSGNTVSLDPNGLANGVVVGSAWRTTPEYAMPTITDGASMTRIASNNTDGWVSTVLSYRNTTATGTANLNWTFAGETTYAVAGLGIGLRPAAASNQNPVAVNDNATTNEDTATTISVLANDTDPESNTLSVSSASNPPKGAAVVNANNTITYTPDSNTNGADSFTYAISDGNGGTATATVNMTVNAINDAPIAVDDNATTTQNVATTITVLANDTDPESNTLSAISASTPAHGTRTINPNNTITYTPATNYTGTDSFTYTISDGNGGTATATVNLTINPPPSSSVQFDNGAAQGGSQLSSLSLNNFTIANQPNRYLVVIAGYTSTTTISGLTWNGSQSLTNLGQITHGDIRMSLWGLKNPTAGAGSITLNFSSTIGGEANLLAASFYNVDQTTPTVGSVVSDAGGGDTIVSIDPSGIAGGVIVGSGWRTTMTSVVQTITDGANMTRIAQNNVDGWLSSANSYRITTGTGTANLNWTLSGSTTNGIAALGIGLRPAAGGGNQNPVANSDNATTNQNIATTITVLANDTDPESNALDVTAASDPPHGTAVVNANETITYTPDNNYTGADSFTYTISDGNGGTATGTVNITVNAAATLAAQADGYWVLPNASGVTLNVVNNDSNPAGGSLTVVNVSTPSPGGSATIVGGNTISYTPAALGTETFNYTVQNSVGAQSQAAVTLNIETINPGTNFDYDQLGRLRWTLHENGWTNWYIYDPNGNRTSAGLTGPSTSPAPTSSLSASPTTITQGQSTTLSYTSTNATSVSISGYGTVPPVRNGSITVAPSATTTYILTAIGPSGQSTSSVQVTVNPPPPPTSSLSASSTTIIQGQSTTLSWTTTNATSASIDNGVGTVSPVAGGSISVSPNATTTYTLTANGAGGQSTSSVTITVNPPPSPTSSLSANPTTVAEGFPTTLTWTSTNATSASISGVGSVTPVAGGSVSAIPPSTPTTTYTLIVTGPGGQSTSSVTVNVTPGNQPPNLNVDFLQLTEGDGWVIIDVLANDTDPENDQLTIIGVSGAHAQHAQLYQNGTLLRFNTVQSAGTYTFDYTVTDGTHQRTTTVWVELVCRPTGCV
jgi:large repetitive protein